jgi:hypothetical protein
VRSTGCVPLTDGVGLFHCVTSFCGGFSFMFTADRDLMPDPEPYLGHVQRSIAEHLAAADGVAPPGPAETATTAKTTQAARTTTATGPTRRAATARRAKKAASEPAAAARRARAAG